MTIGTDGILPLLLDEAIRAPERIFATFDGRPITFGALAGRSASLARALASRGVGAGTRVAVMTNNGPDTLAILFGIVRSGATWVPVNARLKADGLRYVLEHCEPAALVVDEVLLPVVEGCGVDLTGVWTVVAGREDGELGRLLDCGGDPPSGTAPGPDDALAIMYTSGTTGRPKGVVVTHRMMRLAGEAVAFLSDAGSGDTFFVWEPLYHIGGAQLIVLPLIRNVRLAMVERFSARHFWDQVRAEGATHIHYLGGVLQMLLKQDPNPGDRRHSVRIAWGAGCPKEIWRTIEERFGLTLRECYGMTEASSVTTCNISGSIGSVGRPLSWFEVEVLDAGGDACPVGRQGEIVVRTSVPGAIFPGYFRAPDASEKMLRDGALYTGDLGSMDARGDLVFHGRVSDSIRCRGENVSAWEVEHIAAGHEDVEDCAMIGVAADIGEQDIKLFVRSRTGRSVNFPSLVAWLSERLAPYQVPRYFSEVSAFERTPSERIMKHRLSTSRDDCWDRFEESRI